MGVTQRVCSRSFDTLHTSLSLSLNNHFRTTSTLQVIKALTKSSALV